MQTEISETQGEAYRRDGFVKIPALLDATELHQWRDTIGAAVGARKERIPGFGDDGRTGNEYYDNVFTQRVNLWRATWSEIHASASLPRNSSSSP